MANFQAIAHGHLTRWPSHERLDRLTSPLWDRFTYSRAMREHPENPSANSLAAGVTEEDMLAAIEASGYGLQSVAVDKIIATAVDVLQTTGHPTDEPVSLRIHNQEEWSYIDPDSQETRTLDALISINLTNSDYMDKPRAERPAETIYINLDLLIECKQSELPFVFFMRSTGTGDVPRVIGLPHDWLSVKSKDDDFPFKMRVYDALGLYNLPLRERPDTAISMTRTHRKGRSLELSGEEAFRSIALPLSKALRYYENLTQTKEPKLYTHIKLVMPVAVVRAPMIGVSMEDGSPSMIATPWVRLVRMDPGDDSPFSQFCQPVAIDVVHIDYLEKYAKVALESCVEASQRIADFAIPCLTGEAMTPTFSLEDTKQPDDGTASSPKEYYRSMRPTMSGEDFMKRWLEWFWRAHSSDSAEDEPSTRITCKA